MKRVLFIDRDGTLVVEPPVDYQLDSFGKLEFVPKAIGSMSRIATLGFELVMATNQDGLGTESFPEETFWPVQNLIIKTLEGEGRTGKPRKRLRKPKANLPKAGNPRM